MRAAVVALVLVTLAAAPAVSKKTPKPAPAPPPPPAVTPEALAALEGNDEARATETAHKLGEAGDPNAVGALADALGHGATPAVTVALLQALAGKTDARAVAAVERYTHHRTPLVRRAALSALAALPAGDKRALPPLLVALGDSDEGTSGASTGPKIG
jgi:HEAT repeat protein